jgi:hypothetical protein
MAPRDPLPAAALTTRCDPDQFGFATTEELEELEDSLGQDRAVEAVRFGIGMRSDGYNMFALGPPGTGKHTLVRRTLEAAAGETQPSDWVYVNNFAEPHRPLALELPPGRAVPLRGDMENLIAELREAIPAAFESEDYRSRRDALDEQFKQKHEEKFSEIQAPRRRSTTSPSCAPRRVWRWHQPGTARC